MSRYISDLTPGTEVWIDENGEHTAYIYLGIDGSGYCRLLRVVPTGSCPGLNLP